jgi:hypothetical protein
VTIRLAEELSAKGEHAAALDTLAMCATRLQQPDDSDNVTEAESEILTSRIALLDSRAAIATAAGK